MACSKCGQGLVVCIEATEPNETGSFKENYECNVCGAKGFIRGREEQPPKKWQKFGEAF